MKKISYLSTIIVSIILSNISLAGASEVGMPNNDFTRLVCGYLHQIDDKSEALDQIKAMTESKINDSQSVKLDEIAKSEQATKDFCSSSRPRL